MDRPGRTMHFSLLLEVSKSKDQELWLSKGEKKDKKETEGLMS